MLLDALEPVASSLHSPDTSPALTAVTTQVVVAIASVCAYPPGYFENPLTEYAFDLEVERNSVRDLLRSVAVSPAGARSLVGMCRSDLEGAGGGGIRETTAHAFSALAKNVFEHAVRKPAAEGTDIVDDALGCFEALLPELLVKIAAKREQHGPDLQLYRIACLAGASCVPLFAALLPPQNPFSARASRVVSMCAELACHTCCSVKEYVRGERSSGASESESKEKPKKKGPCGYVGGWFLPRQKRAASLGGWRGHERSERNQRATF
jgi:hypothetical protein